jgi:DNA-binding MarR family transcriptional regulator
MRPEEELRYLILGAQREGNRTLAEMLSPLGVTPSQAEAIVCLADGGPMALNALGKLLVCETGSPSRLVDALVGRSIVVRRENPNDRRQLTLELSAAGVGLAREIRKVEAELYGWIGRRLPRQQILATIDALRGLVDGTLAGETVARRKQQTKRNSRKGE